MADLNLNTELAIGDLNCSLEVPNKWSLEKKRAFVFLVSFADESKRWDVRSLQEFPSSNGVLLRL